MTTPDSIWLAPPQVAARLGISLDHVYRLLKAGRIQSFKVGLHGGRYRVTPGQVEDYLTSCRTEPPADQKPRPAPAPKLCPGRLDGQPNRWLRPKAKP